MTELSDIEEAAVNAKGFENYTVDANVLENYNKSYQTNMTTDITVSSRTSKSAGVTMSIDPRLLELAQAEEFSEDFVARRRSTLCLGSACDLVKASIIVGVLYVIILSALLYVTFVDIGANYIKLQLNSSPSDDDQVPEGIDLQGHIALARTGCGMFFSIIGIIGAIRFNRWMVLTASIGGSLYAFSSLLAGRIPGAAIAGFVIYPYAALYLALKKDSITRENYANTKYCCFCPGDNKSNPDY